MELANVIYEKKDYVGLLTLNHPPVNSCNLATLEDIHTALDAFENDHDVRVIVVTGSGEKAFCAGFDVSDVANADKCRTFGQETWTRIDRLTKPVIAAINGFALGGGCELALASHFRIMTDNPKASIGLTELNLGIIPGWGGCVRMCRHLGRAKALDMILFSKRITGQEALEIGLVDKVVPHAEVLKEAMEMAAAISQRPPIAVKFVLKAMSGLMNQNIDEGLRWESEGVKATTTSKDAMEGFAAFFEKRPPSFKGV